MEVPVGSLQDLESAGSLAADLATVMAILAGAIWAYWGFMRERTRWPRANIELEAAHHHLTDRTAALSVKVKVHNAGRGLMKLDLLRVDLYRVLPLSESNRQRVDAGKLIPDGHVDADWFFLEQKKPTWDPLPEVEPNENDAFCVDFLVDPGVQVVFIYAYLENVKKRRPIVRWRTRRHLGWTVSSFYDLQASRDRNSKMSILLEES